MMKNCSHPVTAPPSVTFPEVGASKQQRITWLIQLCKKHVKKYVMLPEMTTIINQIDKLSQCTNQRHPCRMEGCQKSSNAIDVCILCYSTSM